MKIDIKTLAYMYGVTEMYTQLTVVQEDGTPMWAAAGTFRHIVKTYPIVRWLDGRMPWKTVKHLFHW